MMADTDTAAPTTEPPMIESAATSDSRIGGVPRTTPPADEPARDGRLAPPAWSGLIAVAALLVAVEMAVSARYGYHRDELYFVAASDHLAWGYVDQPPLTVAFARVARVLFGHSLVGLRLLPALAVGVLVVLTGLIARELSPPATSRTAQILAAACVAGSSLTIAVGHILLTTTFDLVFWAALLLTMLRLLRTGDTRWWYLAGVLAGVGILNKTTVLQLSGVCLAGLLAERRGRRLTASPRFVAALLIAATIASPYLIWQARHGWPQLDVFADLQTDAGGFGGGLAFIPLQVPLTNIFLAPVWILGLLWLLRSPRGRRWRPVAVGYLLLLAFYTVVGSKPHYASGFYSVLFAAGAVHLTTSGIVRARPLRLRRVLPAVLLVAMIPFPLILPVLPASSLSTTVRLNHDSAPETFAWPRYARQIDQVRSGLPAPERAEAVVVTANYGEAGALARFASASTAARTFSGHNSYWFFGRPSSDGATVIVVGYSRSWLSERFDSVIMARRLDNGAGVANGEQGTPVWICRGMHGSWESTWIDWRHYDG